MSYVDLRAIEARVNAASTGPWGIETDPDSLYGIPVLCRGESLFSCEDCGTDAGARIGDAQFISHARVDVPALIARVRELEFSQVGLATDVVLAEHSAANERDAADRWRDHAKVEYDLRGWLRLCEDNPSGHAEFYQWACHLYFGQPAPGDEDNEDEDDE